MTLVPSVPTDNTPNESRLSSFEAWQASGVCLIAFVLAVPVLFGPGYVAGRLVHGVVLQVVVMGISGMLGGLLVFVGFAYWLRVSPTTFFIRSPDRAMLQWVGITMLLVFVLIGVAIASPGGSTTISPVSISRVVLLFTAAIAVGLWTGIVEEFLLRGVVLSVVGHQWNWSGAILVTALLFGFLHQGAGETTLATGLYVAMTIVVGLLLGILVVSTGNIWNAVAIHATWNAAFSGYMVAVEAVDPDPLIFIDTENGWLLGAGHAAISESPLALGLFALLLGAYWWRLNGADERT